MCTLFSRCTCSHRSSSPASASPLLSAPIRATSNRDLTILPLQWMGPRLRASAAPLSAPFWYTKVNAKEASVPTHLCPVASRLGVVRIYVRGLLSMQTTNGAYAKYSLKCSVMLHFSVRNSSFELW